MKTCAYKGCEEECRPSKKGSPYRSGWCVKHCRARSRRTNLKLAAGCAYFGVSGAKSLGAKTGWYTISKAKRDWWMTEGYYIHHPDGKPTAKEKRIKSHITITAPDIPERDLTINETRLKREDMEYKKAHKSRKRRKRRVEGFVYFMQYAGKNHFKVGGARSIEQRRSEANTWEIDKLWYDGSQWLVPRYAVAERKFHEHFKDYPGKNGECYPLSMLCDAKAYMETTYAREAPTGTE